MLQKSIVKYIQSLQDKKERDISGCFIAEGPKVVGELLASKAFVCTDIFATAEWLDFAGDLIHENASISSIYSINEFELKRISGWKTPQSVLAVFRKKELLFPPVLKGLTVALDGIQDPGNLGTIIRSADWFGIAEIICSPNTVDLYNPKVVQSSMASLANVNVYYMELTKILDQFPHLPAFAATLNGEHPSLLKSERDALLIIGNESKGVSAEVKSRCKAEVSIPRIGKAESLNASIAASILMHTYAIG